jgi:hypothetical protein
MQYCLECGGPNREQARYCGHCGCLFLLPVEEPVTTTAKEKEERTDQEKGQGSHPRVIFSAGVIVGIALIVLGQLVWMKAFPPPATPQEPEDLVENRRTAAERYQAVEQFAERFAEAVREQATKMPTGLDELIFTRVMQNMRLDKLKGIERELLVKYFTVRELEALRRFAETPEGRAIEKKRDKLSEEFQPQVMAEALHAIQETLRELQRSPSQSPSLKDM